MKFETFLSPAKLNLGLKVVGKRDDGYHLLNTIFCLIDLYDRIDIQITNNGKISLIEHEQAWSYKKDLSYRAANLLQEYTGTPLGANIRIKKVIPSGAGLGGGSSNAATVLVVLNQLWKTQLSDETLINLGRTLGADIPFFIYGRNAFATGIGDIFTPINLTPMYFVIVKPNFYIPTRDIFVNLNLDFEKISKNIIVPEALLLSLENDLEPFACKLYPELNQIVNDLSQYGKVQMTGSGSCVYLQFNDKNIAKKVAISLEVRYNTYLAEALQSSPNFTK